MSSLRSERVIDHAGPVIDHAGNRLHNTLVSDYRLYRARVAGRVVSSLRHCCFAAPAAAPAGRGITVVPDNAWCGCSRPQSRQVRHRGAGGHTNPRQEKCRRRPAGPAPPQAAGAGRSQFAARFARAENRRELVNRAAFGPEPDVSSGYENFPHARSVTHQISLLPPTIRTPNTIHA